MLDVTLLDWYAFFPPWPLHPSSNLQMFTVLSIDPVAISGEVGEKEHAVTYLQQKGVITRMHPLTVKV